MSYGNIANAAGTSVDPTHCLNASTAHVSAPALTKSAYGRNDEPIVWVSQYSVTLVSSSSFVNRFSSISSAQRVRTSRAWMGCELRACQQALPH